MRIGVDIDGVLADSLPLWVGELNRFFNKNRRVEEIHLFDICKTYGITERELNEFLRRKGRYLMTGPPPVAGAPYYLKKIKQHHEIFIITARDGQFRRETGEWLEKHGLPYDELILLGSHEKREACLESGLNVLVEDTLEISIKVSSAGVPVLLLDAPYNQGALPGLVYRKRSWEEIYRTIAAGPQQLFPPRLKSATI
ncbi:MAG: hypothetical protein HPY89_12575 [Pelotomaculum sp.]|uniref:Nucleotidase n=1 Tax=Pelotomaculum thermopropionicum (strain DSM 13744 / JCM 10971 / SI) TaxID=370438 RepID=A5CYZ3_PELTS|nr:hypothetical protein [Pelotomaculum sp.]BAF60776.1 uncharacterized conserved protein [Pelotomaculum thermopropionicum SI]